MYLCIMHHYNYQNLLLDLNKPKKKNMSTYRTSFDQLVKSNGCFSMNDVNSKRLRSILCSKSSLRYLRIIVIDYWFKSFSFYQLFASASWMKTKVGRFVYKSDSQCESNGPPLVRCWPCFRCYLVRNKNHWIHLNILWFASFDRQHMNSIRNTNVYFPYLHNIVIQFTP